MYEYFPGNYRWSFAVHNTLRCGGQMGEIDRALRPLLEADSPSAADWGEAWAGAGDEQSRLGEADLARGFEISAGERFLRSSVYYIAAERQMPHGDRRSEIYQLSLETFQRGVKLAGLPWERVEIDSPDGILPAMFLPADGPGPHPTMIFFDGFDITKEIMSLTVRDSLKRRGISCLVVDSPGVGEPLRLRNVPSRPDYEVPAGAFIDYLETRDDVDPDRIGVMGISLGGYYAPRAAAFEPRIKCVVAWGAILDWGATWQKRWATRSTEVSVPLDQLMWVLQKDTMEEALERVKEWTLVDVLPRITQPALVMHGENDRQIPLDDAYKAFELISSTDKELKIFTLADGGAEHCHSDEPAGAINYVSDWAAEKLRS
ncbi:prolyl oligopeptidase family serine peptidase [Pseudonocardia ailaonensis]|uniref:Prolyl oligopeptidase family serine peptidase n=1 Tax=Pseudonocardia ailaonensis TaxID=367279 RepID=A0ABN2N7E3_9PSEU